jgi:hypothetical protein
VLLCTAFGCFFELGEVVPLPSVGGNGGSGGDSGQSGEGGSGLGGDGPAGGTGGTPVNPACSPNEKNCGNGCVPMDIGNGCGDPSCTPCAPLGQASLRCNVDSRVCEFDQCEPGFADCNADTGAYTGVPGSDASDGCEYNFGPNGELRAAPPALEVPQVSNIDITDGERGDWTGIPAYPLLATCEDCVDTSLPTVALPNVVPARKDLDAYFRVAWDEAFFYLLGDVHDTSVVADGEQRDGNCQGAAAALCEDSFSVLVDGHNDRLEQPTPQADDLYLFLGLGSKAFRYSQRPVAEADMSFIATPHGAACYRIEARFTWAYMTGLQGGLPEPEFAPAVGKQYGFDVAVNDWDPGISDPGPQRESQLFWVSPGNGFQQNTTNFGAMTLTEGITSGPSAPD